MTKYLIIISIVLTSCALPVPIPQDDSSTIKLRDTSVKFLNDKQNIKIFYDKDGNIEIIQSKNNDSVQNIFFNKSGNIIQIQNNIADKKETEIYFFKTGQVEKIKKFNDLDNHINDAFVWFVPSNSKNLTVDYGKSFMLSVSGLQDTFLINKDYTLEIKDLFSEIKHSDFELVDVDYDTNFVDVTKFKSCPTMIRIKANKQGTFRLNGIIRFINHNDKLYSQQGVDHKLDINLTFK